jgi:hypothetical protein
VAEQTVQALPFEIASQFSSRTSFQIPTTALQAAAPTQVTPQQVPAVGYIHGIMLEVTLTGTGGTTPAFTADAPFNAIQQINFRNAAGVNLIAPVDGYSLYLINKYGGQQVPGFGPYASPKFGLGYTATAPSAHYFLWLPLGIDAAEAYGAIPALASNANYQVELTFNAQSLITTSNPTLSVAVNATAFYFDLPAAQNAAGVPQATNPAGDATSIWNTEQPTITPGTQLVQSFNVGNVIRNHILIIRNSAGARIDTNGAPNLWELYLDNQPRFSISRSLFEDLMARWYGATGAKDSVTGLDTGVYVFPYHALLGSMSGDPANTRAQLLPTLNATLLQFRAQDFGSAVSKLQILTQSVTTRDAGYLFSK